MNAQQFERPHFPTAVPQMLVFGASLSIRPVHARRIVCAALTSCCLMVGCDSAPPPATPGAAENASPNATEDSTGGYPPTDTPAADAASESADSAPPATPQISANEFRTLAGEGNAARVLLALERGMPIDSVDENGVSALMAAALNGHSRTVKMLLDKGADPTRKDAAGRTALMYGSTFSDLPTIKLLIDAGSPINAADNVEGFTALMFAAGEGLAPVVTLLLEQGADPTLKDIDGDTAEDFARRNNHAEAVQAFAAARTNTTSPSGADPERGETPDPANSDSP